MAAIADGGAAPVRLARRFISLGVAAYPPRVARRLSIVNLIALVAAFANLLYCTFYAALGFADFWPIVVATLVHAAVNLSTPLWHRFGPMAAPAWLTTTMLAANLIYTYALGADSGQQYYLFAAAAAMPVLFGSDRLWPATAFAVCCLMALMAAELLIDEPAAFLGIDPWIPRANLVITLIISFLILFAWMFYVFRLAERAEEALEREYERSERLLDNLLPESISARLKDSPDQIIADDLGQVTILFADIAEFTPRATSMPAPELVRFLNRIFTEFDHLSEARGLEKIKTIGDAYMVAAGLPRPRQDHATAVAELALEMLAACARLSDELGQAVEVRIGIHTGPVVAGVIGTRKFFYDVWGDTVNTAARMESHGEPGRIQVTEAARAALGEAYAFEARGPVEIKGKGRIETWWLTGRA
ncbi:MAG: adenylate/guanylate cyclase domain-containing protein [Alphaproteobacteria bacterium]|jgi:adenylate cyclase|nr:adenylate/guanylate cyclase domain-containing protein [Alphaproteobacteria bacterium]MDP6564005.1 adenylate/guanylate cyclase domain-containing protein [Alphaproteobacteria bacterium]MDP6814148.1 adenylate/guanylate cyclase domain-containing protein [Alphaproteobacteria bacterium]